MSIYDDIVYRLRTEHERFARVPQENKFMLGPLVHGRLSSLFTEAADEIERLRELLGNPEQLELEKTDGK